MPCVTRCRAIARTEHLRGAVGAELADVRQQAHEHQDTSVCARASAVQRQRQSPLFASAQAGTWRGSHGMMKQNACIRPACQSRTAPHTCLPVRCVRRAAPSTASACSSSSGRAAVQAPLLRQEPLRVAPSDRRCRRLGASRRSLPRALGAWRPGHGLSTGIRPIRPMTAADCDSGSSGTSTRQQAGSRLLRLAGNRSPNRKTPRP